MSTPAGQSRCSPCRTGTGPAPRPPPASASRRRSSPVAISSSTPGPAAGGVLLLPGGQVARAHHAAVRVVGDALADAHAAVGGPCERAARRAAKPAAPSRESAAPANTRRSASSRAGRTSTPGLSRSSGSKMRLDLREQRRWPPAEYIRGSSSARARPSPCSPDSDPPCAPTRSAASLMNDAEVARPPGSSSGRSRSGRAGSRRRSGRRAPRRAPCSRQQRVELAQVGAEPLGRHRGVLPARPGRPPAGARATRPAPSSRIRHRARCSRRVGDDHAVAAAGDRATTARAAASASAGVVAADLDVQPAAARRQRREAVSTGSARNVAIRASMPSMANGPARRSPSRASRGVGVREAEHGQRAGRRRSTSRTVAPSTTQVPSVPTRARARSNPCSGSSWSRL